MSRAAFNPRGVLALVLFGSVVFLALLWALGAGLTGGNANDGGGHAEGTGLNGYAALARLLEAQGHQVVRSRARSRLDDPGLLVLTPPLDAEAESIAKILEERRYVGPTLLVLPKWRAVNVSGLGAATKAKPGWVVLAAAETPAWADAVFDEPELTTTLAKRGKAWAGLGKGGALARPDAVQAISGAQFVPLVQAEGGGALAGYVADGFYRELAAGAGIASNTSEDEDVEIYPLVIVAEPDLLDNMGLAHRDRAMLALALVGLARGSVPGAITFDLTLNGLASSANLLTLAFTPPFVAATLCLLLAALAAGWRAFNRFGPPREATRAIAFGKRALVANAAGLIRRSGRLRLVAAPFANAARERLARALGLPRHADAAETEAAIDRALEVRAPDAAPFSTTAAALRAARRRPDMLRAAQALHALERTLTR
jgi:hypothetical protein